MAVLKQGDTGKKVEELQKKLNASKRAGTKLKVDGIFGPKTLAAVKTFQKASYLKVDGVVGPKTMAVLDSTGKKAPKLETVANTRFYNDMMESEKYATELLKKTVASDKKLEKLLAQVRQSSQDAVTEGTKLIGKVKKNQALLLKVAQKELELANEYDKIAQVNVPRALEIKKEIEKLGMRAYMDALDRAYRTFESAVIGTEGANENIFKLLKKFDF